MKHILFTLALASIAGIANAQHNGHSYTVEGLINDSTLNGQTLYISRYDDGMKVDSTQVTNGQFKFTGKADIPCFCRIDAGREYANFILEGGNIQVNVLTHNDPKGTPMNEEYTNNFPYEDTEMVEKKTCGHRTANRRQIGTTPA